MIVDTVWFGPTYKWIGHHFSSDTFNVWIYYLFINLNILDQKEKY